jgi:hypothetical protein
VLGVGGCFRAYVPMYCLIECSSPRLSENCAYMPMHQAVLDLIGLTQQVGRLSRVHLHRLLNRDLLSGFARHRGLFTGTSL